MSLKYITTIVRLMALYPGRPFIHSELIPEETLTQ